MFFRYYFHPALIIFGALLLSAYLHPYHIHPFRTYYHDALAVLGTLIAFGLLAFAARPRLHLPALSWLPLAIVLMLLLQMALGLVSIENIVFPLMYLLLASLAMVLGATWASLAGGADKVCLMLSVAHLAAALVSVMMQSVQMAGLDMSPFIMVGSAVRPYANVAQPNQLALLLCFGLASIWWLYQAQRLGRSAAVVLVLVLLWGLSLTQSRIAWIILPLFALYCARQREGQYAVHRFLLLFFLVTYAGFVFGLPMLGKVFGVGSTSVVDRIGGRSERMVLMQQAWTMASQHPWLGVGWFGFAAEQVRIGADFTPSTYAEHAHNLPLNFAAELGWPFTLLLGGYLLWWAWRVFFCRMMGSQSTSLGLAALCLMAVGVHSMVEFPLWYAYVLLPIAVLMGMANQLRRPSYGVAVPSIAVVSVAAFGGLLLVLVTFDYQRVVAGFKAQRPGYEAAKAALVRPSLTLFGDYFSYFELMKMAPKAGMSALDIAFVENMSRRFGYVHVLNKLAEVYALNGQPAKALRMMVTLQRLHPDSYPGYFDFWKGQSDLDPQYAAVFASMPKRNAN